MRKFVIAGLMAFALLAVVAAPVVSDVTATEQVVLVSSDMKLYDVPPKGDVAGVTGVPVTRSVVMIAEYRIPKSPRRDSVRTWRC